MRILVSTSPSFGLYFPVVPLAWALRSAGHEVVVASPENMAETVNGSGLPFVPNCGPLPMRDIMLFDRAGEPIVLPDTEEELLAHTGRAFGRLGARTLDGMLKITGEWKPDVVVGEPHSYAAAAAAAVHGVPFVEHGIGLGYLAVIDEHGHREFAPELAGLGLPRLPDPALVVDTCLPGVHPGTSRPNTAPMGYVPFSTPGTVPPWVFGKPERPRLLLTLGTVPVPGRVELFAALLKMLSTLDVDLLLAVEDAVVQQLSPLPPSVLAAGWLSLDSVLPACDLVVHHCGAGTVMAALREGLPQVLIPHTVEQYDSARRLEAFGAARRIALEDLDPEQVLDACRALLEDPSYRDRARELRDQLLELPSPGRLVAAIEGLTAERGTR
jgi:UDP:flavonoid glycosyltransferase YjiC (YdhE family)